MRDDDDLGWSIKKTAEKTSESVWKVKDRLRRGEYEAVKAGRRTIIKPGERAQGLCDVPSGDLPASSSENHYRDAYYEIETPGRIFSRPGSFV
jgi:hypothetical protein